MMAHGKGLIPVLLIAGGLAGFRSGAYSLDHLGSGAPPIMLTILSGWLGGSLLTPLLKPWLPGHSNAMKGLSAGGLALVLWPAACLPLHLEPLDVAMALLVIPAMASLLACRLPDPGPAPDASRRWTPLQVAPIALATGIWIMARFV